MQLASQLKDTYSGKEPADYFKTVYTVRSRIVHGVHDYDGKNKRPTTQDIKAANPELQRFATDLLKAESVKSAE